MSAGPTYTKVGFIDRSHKPNIGDCDTDPERTGRWVDRIREPQTGTCDGGHGEIVNASALLKHLCEVLGVPLVDLVKTVEALPRWVPARDVPYGTPLLAYAVQGKFLWSACAEPSPIRLSNESHDDLASRDFYLLVGPTLYPKPPKVSP